MAPCLTYAQSNRCVSNVESAAYNPAIGSVLVGAGRLQFYKQPFLECEMKGVFVIPGDVLTVYSSTIDDKWVEVMYVNPKNSNEAFGWVQKNRIKEGGTIRPKS